MYLIQIESKLETKVLHIIVRKDKSCKETGLHRSNEFPHSTERKTVTVIEIFIVSKEEQHQSLHYIINSPRDVMR